MRRGGKLKAARPDWKTHVHSQAKFCQSGFAVQPVRKGSVARFHPAPSVIRIFTSLALIQKA